PSAGLLLQSPREGSHARTKQAPPSQRALAWGREQGVHVPGAHPKRGSSIETHAPPQSFAPAPHDEPSPCASTAASVSPASRSIGERASHALVGEPPSPSDTASAGPASRWAKRLASSVTPRHPAPVAASTPAANATTARDSSRFIARSPRPVLR